jgi:hypothetical protein
MAIGDDDCNAHCQRSFGRELGECALKTGNFEVAKRMSIFPHPGPNGQASYRCDFVRLAKRIALPH